MALRRNYPLGNDISTQFLPASLSLGNGLLPQACGWRVCGPRRPQSSCYLIPQGREMEKLWAMLVTEQLLSDPRVSAELSFSQIKCDVAQQAVKISDFSAAHRRGYPLKASGFNDPL